MSNKNDFVHDTGRPDYYTIIRRRKRSVEDILGEHGIDSLKKLKQFKKQIEGTYSISQEFMEEAEGIIHEMSLSEKASEVLEQGLAELRAETPAPKKKKTSRKKKKKPSKKDVESK